MIHAGQVVAAVALSAGLVACGGGAAARPVDEAPPTVVTAGVERYFKIVTATSNEPRRHLTTTDRTLLDEATATNKAEADVVIADGGSFRTALHLSLVARRGNELEQDPDLRAQFKADALQQIDAAVNQATSTGGQLDAVGIFDYVSRIPGPAVVSIATSGLQTFGPFDFNALTWDGVGADETIKAAQDRDLIPDLRGKTIYIGGPGDVAGPQARIPEVLRKRIRDFLLRICEAGQAERCVPDDEYAGSEGPLATVPVPTVPVPAPEPLPVPTAKATRCEGFDVPSDLWFLPNSSELLPGMSDQAQALGATVPKTCNVHLVGRTASVGSASTSRELSRSRAERIAAAMILGGFPTDQISVEGVGYDQPIVPDRDTSGRLIPEAAQRNRAVSLLITPKEG